MRDATMNFTKNGIIRSELTRKSAGTILAAFTASFLLFAHSAVAAPAARIEPKASSARTASAAKQTPPVRFLQPGEYVPDEILVMPRSGLDEDALNESLEAVHGKIKEIISNGTLTTYVVEVDKSDFSKSFYKLRADKNFDVVQCNLISRMQALPFPEGPPNDPSYPQQYHLPLLQIPQAWALAGNGGGIAVGIIDSGVDSQEPDLYGRVIAGYNVITGGPANTDTSKNGHGTAVATLMAAGTNNGVLGASPAFNIAIYPTDVFNGAKNTTDSKIIKAYTWLENLNVRLINISLNDTLPNSLNNQNAHPALWKYFKDFWTNRNGFTVNSTGNESTLDNSPLSKYLIVTSAIDSTSEPASFSNYGPGISFASPGVNVGTGSVKNKFTYYSGTSYACPLVTGVIAQALANNLNKSNELIYSALIKTVTTPPKGSRKYPDSYYYGYGIPSAYQLLETLMSQ
jgi:thermitase